MEALTNLNTNKSNRNETRLPAAVNDRLELSWLGRTATGTITRIPDSPVARGYGEPARFEDYHFEPDAPVGSDKYTTTWVVDAWVVERAVVAALVAAAAQEQLRDAA